MSEHSPTGARGVVRALRRRLVIVLTCLLVVPAAAAVVSLLQDKEYRATASLLFRQPKIDEVVAAGTVFADISDPNRFAVTNLELISLDVVAERTAERLGLDAREVSNSVEISPKGQSDVAVVTATATSPGTAARLANTYAEVYIAMREASDHALIRDNIGVLQRRLEALPPEQRSGPEGDIAQDRINRLKLLDNVKLGGIQLVDTASPPSSPSAPKPVRSALIGLALGALLGLGLALLLERLDGRLKEPEDVKAVFARPLLAQIPASDSLRLAASNGTPLVGREADVLKSLRTKLRHFSPGEDVSSVLIASAIRGEGRTTVAWNVAAISTSLGLSVLLVEADFHHPVLADALGIPRQRGLAQALAGEAPFETLVHPIETGVVDQRSASSGSLNLLVAGIPATSSIDLIDSHQMRDLLSRAEEEYDLVVVDGPAVSESEDVLPLARMVGAVIVVSRLGVLTRDAANGLAEQLREMGVRPLGVVLNSVERVSGELSRERASTPSRQADASGTTA